MTRRPAKSRRRSARSRRRKDAWLRRIQSGQSGADMVKMFNTLGTQRTLAMFTDWTDRIAKGEVPPPPPRPQGVERNVVITQWNWGDGKTYMHDLAVTDRRSPTVNANGLVFSSPEMSTENTPVLDPATSKISVLASAAAGSEDTDLGPARAEDVAVLGRRSDLDEPKRRAQLDVRRTGPPVDDGADPSARDAGVLQGRIEPSVGETASR